MFFPPPARYYVPLLVLIFGLATTGLDYELNLANDLARNLKDVVAEMDATGEQMASAKREADWSVVSQQCWLRISRCGRMSRG